MKLLKKNVNEREQNAVKHVMECLGARREGVFGETLRTA